MGLALDEPRDDDHCYDIEGLKFLVGAHDSSYITGGNGVKVEYTKSFFGEGFFVSMLGHAGSCGC